MKNIISIIIALSIFSSCSNSDDSSNCDKNVIINKTLYNETNTENYFIDNVTINGDCIDIEISSSGCDGNSWVIELIDLGAIAESNPIQRNLKIRLTNSEICQAYFTRQITFNIKPLRTNENEILLNLEEWDGLILYSY